MTPAGTSEVARHSARVMAGSARFSLATTTAVFPPAITGAKPRINPSNEDFCSAMIPTTPSGSGIVKL